MNINRTEIVELDDKEIRQAIRDYIFVKTAHKVPSYAKVDIYPEGELIYATVVTSKSSVHVDEKKV